MGETWRVVERTVNPDERRRIEPGTVVQVHKVPTQTEAEAIASVIGVNGYLEIPDEHFIETYRFVDG